MMFRPISTLTFLLLLPLLGWGIPAGCGDDANDDVADDALFGDTTGLDADTGGAVPDTAVAGDDVYGPVAPPAGPVAEALQGDRWITHWREDLEPYWTIDAAKGEPVGNFPTSRGMNGQVVGSSQRRPRMISRQIHTYSVGYMLTGDEALLELAGAGVDWLRAKAIDRTRGGCAELLEADGAKVAGTRTAQDLSYCMLGLASYYFVTRDAGAEADIEAGRGWLFDPAKFWDADNGRIRDALQDDMSTEVDVEGDGGWELVAQLDAINGFMLLAQPVLSEASSRDRFLADLKTLGELLVRDFLQDDIFWGVSNRKGQYGTKHVDFGHTLKSYWMLLEIDKRLDDHPFHDVIFDAVHGLVERAYDDGRWAKRPTSPTGVEYGSDWWIYAEVDQIAATLNLIDHRYSDELAQTAAHWISDYVDDRYDIGEVIPGINRDGSPVWNWGPTDDAKCNYWKNGFHSAEHALVFYLLGRQLEGEEATLHFAVPADLVDTFIARPYLFHGREVSRTAGDTITVGDDELVEVAVRFADIY